MEHSFKVALAKEFGLEEAIFVHNLYYWIREHEVNNRNFIDGRFWTYNSQKAYADWFSYLSAAQIKRIVNSLIKQGIILKGNYNENQYDRTNWYAFTDDGLAIVQKCYIHWTKMTNGRVENRQPIPNNKPYNKQDNNIYIFSPSDEGSETDLFGQNDNATITITMPSPAEHTECMGAAESQMAEQFEDLWLMYERKGSKANAKKEFAKLTADEIIAMQRHIPAYIESRPERQYRLDFERYIKYKTFNSVVYSKQNTVLYDPDAVNTSATQEKPLEFAKENENLTINGITYR